MSRLFSMASARASCTDRYRFPARNRSCRRAELSKLTRGAVCATPGTPASRQARHRLSNLWGRPRHVASAIENVIGNSALLIVGRPILAAAGFQPARISVTAAQLFLGL